MHHLISVIVPIYNAEKYLRYCLDTILAQTFSDFELLLIDDGSKDNSGKICDEYAGQDTRVKVFHKENGGVSSARNFGIHNATGKWLVFVDADDWIDQDYLECLYPKNENELVCCSFVLNDETEESSWNVFLSNCENTIQALDNNLTKFAFCSVCCKVFNTAIAQDNNVLFREQISQGEDGLFVLDYLCAAHLDIRTLSKAAYHYRYDYKDRTTYKAFPKEQAYTLMDLLSDRLDKIQATYGCANIGYLKSEMICSQAYNIYRTIKDSEQDVITKIHGYVNLLKNKNMRNLLANKKYLRRKHRGLCLYYLMRVVCVFL